jgi:hypothetical protein
MIRERVLLVLKLYDKIDPEKVRLSILFQTRIYQDCFIFRST